MLCVGQWETMAVRRAAIRCVVVVARRRAKLCAAHLTDTFINTSPRSIDSAEVDATTRGWARLSLINTMVAYQLTQMNKRRVTLYSLARHSLRLFTAAPSLPWCARTADRHSMHARAPDEHRNEQPHHQQEATKDLLQQPALHATVKLVDVTAAQCRHTLHQQGHPTTTPMMMKAMVM